MSFLVNLLCRGNNQPSPRGFAAWLGRRLALRNPRVTIAPDAAISPAAMIHPRSGAVEIGARSMVSPGAVVAGNVKIGNDSSVQNYTIVVGYGTPDDPAGLVRIGNGVRIGAHCMIIGGNHRFSDPSTPNAWISKNEEDLQQYVESKEPEKNTLLEKLNKFDGWLLK